MTKIEELKKLEKEYNNLHNDGGQGYNPYTSQIDDLNAIMRAAMEPTDDDKRYRLNRAMTAETNGLNRKDKLDAIQLQLDALGN